MIKKILLGLLLCLPVMAQTNLGPIGVTTVDSKGTSVTPNNPKAGHCRSYFDLGTSRIAWIDHTGAPCGPVPGTSAIANVYTAGLPLPSIQGTFGFNIPASGLRNLSLYNGANWFNVNPYMSDAGLWGCDNTAATDAAPCLDAMQIAATGLTGSSINIPAGTYLIGSEFHIRRPTIWNGQGSSQIGRTTNFKLAPGAGIILDKSTASTDGGGSDFTLMRSIAISGTSVACTGTATSGVLTACGTVANLNIAAGDYVMIVGTNPATQLWEWAVAPDLAIVASTTANTITLAGGAVSAFTATMTVMKSGNILATGTTAASVTITGVSCVLCWEPGDPIQGPGIVFPSFITARNPGAGTLTLNQAASGSVGAGNLVKGPMPGILSHGNGNRFEDIEIDTVPGYGFDNNGGNNYSPTTIADANHLSYVRVTLTGQPCIHKQGADANTGVQIGSQMTRCAGGNDSDQSFLGNTSIGPQGAGSGSGPCYETTGNAIVVLVNPYCEGGQFSNDFNGTTLILGGVNMSSFQSGKGNYIGASGLMSPTFNFNNDQSGSTAFCLKGSNQLTSVTSIANWHVGDPIIGGCIGNSYTVTATDGVSVLTLSGNALGTSTFPIAFTQTRVNYRLGPAITSSLAVADFSYTNNNVLLNHWTLELDDPYHNVTGHQPGFFSWRYRNQAFNIAIAFPTDLATNPFDPPGGNGGGPPTLPLGLRIGGTNNTVLLSATTSTTCPTVGTFNNGSIEVVTTGGLCQQITPAKTVTGHTDIAIGSTALASQDSAFLAGCTTNDPITGTGIQTATFLVNQNTLSKAATATTATLAVNCTRLPKAHVVTSADTASGTNTLLNVSPTTGWAVNDTVRGTGIPAGTFIQTIVGTTFTISNNATASATVPISDAVFQTYQVVNGTTPVVKVVSGTLALTASSAASGVCNTVSTTATGALTTDTLSWAYNSTPAGVTGYGGGTTGNVVQVYPYLTAGNVNANICNNTASSISYGLVTLRWTVER